MLRSFLVLFLCLQISYVHGSISPRTYNKLNEIQQSIDAQPNKEERLNIESKLTELAENLTGNALGLALTLQTHAQLKIQKEKYNEATSLLKHAIKIERLDDKTRYQLKTFLAQLYFMQNKYTDVITILKQALHEQEGSESPSAYALLAAAYYSLDSFKEGLPHIEKAISLKKEMKEPWLQMAFTGNYQLKKFRKALIYNHLLLLNFPDKKQYWQQKAGIHQFIEQYSEASVVKELALHRNLLTSEADFINLGQLLASQGSPYKVAITLEAAVANKKIEASEKLIRLTYQAWLQSREMKHAQKTLELLFSRFKQPKDGIELLRHTMDAEQWSASLSISENLNKLDLIPKQKGQVLLFEGIANYKLGNQRQAILFLSKAMGIETSKSQAKGWLNYVKQ